MLKNTSKLQSWQVAGLIAAGSQVFLSTTFCNGNRAGCRTRVRDSFSVLSSENWKLSTSTVDSVLFTLDTDTLSELSLFHQTGRSNFQTPSDLFLHIKEMNDCFHHKCPCSLQLLHHQQHLRARQHQWVLFATADLEDGVRRVRLLLSELDLHNKFLIACADSVQGHTLQRKVTARLGTEVHRGCPGQSGRFRPRCNSKGIDLIDPNREGKKFWPAGKT